MSMFEAVITLIVALLGLGGSVWAAYVGKSVKHVSSAAKVVQYEMQPNGGNSLRDAINEIKEDVSKLVKAQEEDEKHQVATDARLAVLEARRPFWRR